jgi:protein-arginine kinase activator protein McsA
MLCCHCKKNQAIKTREKVLAGGKAEASYFCLDCYHKLFLTKTENAAEVACVCARCGMTASEFLRTKLVGCAECYQNLAGAIAPVLEKMQACDEHIGGAELISERERLGKRAHELQILFDKRKAEFDFEAQEKKAKELAELRERIAALKGEERL